MSRREQSDRHIIWSNMNLEADDWRDSYKAVSYTHLTLPTIA